MCMEKFDAEKIFLTNSMQGVSSKSYLLPSFVSIVFTKNEDLVEAY